MKKNKAVNVTKGDIKSGFRTDVADHSYCYNNISGNARTYIRHATIRQNQTGPKGFDFQYVDNRSHLTCSCENSNAKYPEASYFTTTLNQTRSKSYTDVGVGIVKALQRRKVKRIYLPETEERAVGTLDFLLCENPKCQQFTRFNEYYHRTSRKGEERAIHSNRIHFLDKKLSPLLQTKSNCTNPLSTHFLINESNKSVDNTPINKLTDAPTQVGPKKLSKSQKIKIFKELSMNTDSIDTEKIAKSEIEISLETSNLMNDKNGAEFSSSLDSLVQHVYNLDRPSNGATSQVSVDPMENKLEREYRKIFSNQPRDCPCNNEFSTTNSDSLLRRFEALPHDVPCENDLKKNTSKTSSEIIEPNYKDVSIESDPPSLRSPSNSNIKIVSPVPSSNYKKVDTKIAHKKSVRTPKIRKSSHWCSSDGEDYQGIKGMFKLWGKKLSLEDGCYKRSKLKCFDIKKRSEGNVKSNKPLKNKSRDKKECKKFRFFKKKNKVSLRASKPKKDVMTGRCEVREGLTIKIGKSFLSQDQHAISVKKVNSKYDDLLLKAWLQKFVSQSVESTKNLAMKWDSSVFADCSDATELKTNISSDTDILLFSNRAIKNDSLKIGDKKSLISFSRQYIQAWMIPKTILDRLVKTKIYCNAKGDKYNRKKDVDISHVNDYKCLKDKQVFLTDDRSVLDNSTSTKDGHSSECIMVNISLGCISEFNHQTYVHRQSNEEVYNVINYETPLASSVNFSKIDNKKQVPSGINDSETSYNKKYNKGNKVLNNDDRPEKSEIIEDNKLLDNTQTPKTTDEKKIKCPMYGCESVNTCKSLKGSLYLLPKNCKHAEIYLKKYFHNWIPLGLDLHLWCISDPKFHSGCNEKNKDESFKSYPNVTDQIRYTTLVTTSHDATVENELEKFDPRDKYNYIKTIIRKNKSEIPLSDLGIRIWPKDSLKVLKKRKLYSNSNKAKWNYDKDSSVPMSNSIKSKSHLIKFTSNKRPQKKRVTISEIEVTDSKFRLPLKMVSRSENEIKKNKNVSYLTASQQASESVNNNSIVEPKPKIKNKEDKVTSLTLLTESDDTNSAEDSDNCTATSDTEENSKCLSASKNNAPKTPESPNYELSNLKKFNNSDNQTEKNIEKANKVTSKAGFNFSDCLKPSTIRNKCNNLRQKFTLEKKGGSDESIKSDNRTRKCSITTDVQKISSLSKTFPTDDKFEEISKFEISRNEPEINNGKGKMLGFHIKKPPVKKNMSRACSTLGDKNYFKINGNSADNMENTPVKENKDLYKSIKEEIYREYNNKKIESKSTSINLSSKDSHLCTISVSGSMKNLYVDKELNNEQRNDENKGSDFIEISFKIKRKQNDDNINGSSDRNKKQNKKMLKRNKSSITNKNKTIFLVQNNSESSTVYENHTSCVNVKILIKSYKHNNYFDKKSSHRDKFSIYSKRISEKFQTVSSGFTKPINGNLNSIPNFKIDSTDLVDNLQSNNEPIQNFESFTLKEIAVKCDKSKLSDEQRWINDKPNIKPSIKPQTDETGNENHRLSCEKPCINCSFDNRKISNCKELKKAIIKKIVHCVRDLSKSKRKEKINDVKRALRSILLSNYSYNNVYVNNYEQIVPISSNLTNVTDTTHDFYNFNNAMSLKAQNNIRTNNYYYTVVTEGKKQKKVVMQLTSTDCERNKGQCSKTLDIKSGVTDLRTCECSHSLSEDVKSNLLSNNKKREPIMNHVNLKEDFVHYIPSNIFKKSGNKIINLNDSFIKSFINAEAIITRGQVQQKRDDINVKLVNKRSELNNTIHSAVCMQDEIDVTTVCSNFYKEKLITSQNCKVNSNTKYKKELEDIFQLPEIKRAVFELYNVSENLPNSSDLFKTLPKFVNEVENVLFV